MWNLILIRPYYIHFKFIVHTCHNLYVFNIGMHMSTYVPIAIEEIYSAHLQKKDKVSSFLPAKVCQYILT